MLDFQRYQLAFTAHIRNPKLHAKPANVVEKRMSVYRESVFNNIFESVSVCFPVCQNVLGKRKWRHLIRNFVANYSAISPFFREIPQQFLAFLENITDLPSYLKPLAHYEWIELAISSQQTRPLSTQQTLNTQLNCMDDVITLAPASALLAYDYPVHKISKRFKPAAIEKTYLLVFRNTSFEVKFIVLNPVTFNLLSLTQSQPLTGRLALTTLANELQHPDLDLFMRFGAEILHDLCKQQAITLSQNTLDINIPQ
ncbi:MULTISPECIES: HvfC family RiPP maturation protein [Methylotenera]|uniref:HvfC family RiPP maturation protein n=1 Tax=Methylotenera TaxID=359407 RepID=UPI000370A0D5|nr:MULTISPECIES: putative DNA-binding domain-containing protein [Methylotenera]